MANARRPATPASLLCFNVFAWVLFYKFAYQSIKQAGQASNGGKYTAARDTCEGELRRAPLHAVDLGQLHHIILYYIIPYHIIV